MPVVRVKRGDVVTCGCRPSCKVVGIVRSFNRSSAGKRSVITRSIQTFDGKPSNPGNSDTIFLRYLKVLPPAEAVAWLL